MRNGRSPFHSKFNTNPQATSPPTRANIPTNALVGGFYARNERDFATKRACPRPQGFRRVRFSTQTRFSTHRKNNKDNSLIDNHPKATPPARLLCLNHKSDETAILFSPNGCDFPNKWIIFTETNPHNGATETENIITFAMFLGGNPETYILVKVFSHYPSKKIWQFSMTEGRDDSTIICIRLRVSHTQRYRCGDCFSLFSVRFCQNLL